MGEIHSMGGQIGRRRTVVGSLFVAMLVVAGGLSAQVTLQLVPSSPAAPPGGSVDIAVEVSGLGNLVAPSIGVFDLDVTFDPALFSFAGVSFGALLGDPGAAEAITGSTPGASDVNVLEVSLLLPAQLVALQPDTFTLFTLTFDNLAQGIGAFDAMVVSLGDENANPLMATIVPATVQAQSISDIPTLGSAGVVTLVLLLLSGGLLVLRRTGS